MIPRLILLVSALLVCACEDTSETLSKDTAEDTHAVPEGSVRFAIEVTNDVPETIWVQLNDLSGQIAWVTLLDASGNRVYLEEQCGIEDCDSPTGVCGAAEPRVRDITGGTYTGSIEHLWDTTTSVVENGCESRQPAPNGTYTARFCWSLTATTEGDGDPTVSIAGTLDAEVCQERSFTLPGDTRVVFAIQGG